MKITPLISADILGRYTKKGNCVIDTFENVTIPTKNANQLLNKLNKLGEINAKRVQDNKPMLSLIA